MTKNTNAISWDDFFIGVAELASKRSKDPRVQIGACIVNDDNRIVSVGYNGFPRGCSDDEYSWEREAKQPYVIHAEENCILNSDSISKLKGSKLYLYSIPGYYPCCKCARLIVQVGIKEVIMNTAIKENTDHYDWEPTFKMFKSGNVKIRILNEQV